MPTFDFKSAATTLTSVANKTLSSTGLAQGLSSAAGSLAGAVNQFKSGIPTGLNNITAAIPGLAGIQSALENAKKSVTNFGNLFDNATKNVTIESSGLAAGDRLPNVLHYYSSFNYIFTLSVLDDYSINFPNETYRRGQVGSIILKSGSGNPDDRVPLSYKLDYNKQGGFEFFMDNLEIKGAYGFEKATGNTNTTAISFKVTEPYSMGLFFETLQAAAAQAGHPNYTQVPILLSIEFKGHLGPNQQSVQIDNANVRIPLKIMTVNMKVTGKGCEYDIQAYPWNEQGYGSVYSRLKSDVSIVGKTVIEMLQTGEDSLQYNLNRWLSEAVRRKDVNVPDQILISFPNDLKSGDSVSPPPANSATVNPNTVSSGGDFYGKLGLKGNKGKYNTTQVQIDTTVNDIGKSGLGFSLFDKGTTPFAKDNFVFDQDKGVWVRGNMSINPKESAFQFKQGCDIINTINQVILMSDYGRTALQQVKNGMIQWWRVEAQTYNIPTDENLKKTGVKPRLIVYRVIPYLVSQSQFLPPNTAPDGVKKVDKDVVKEYEYIYTGQNTDIIDWDIQFQNSFYRSLNADSAKNNEGVDRQGNNGGAAPDKDDPHKPSPDGAKPTKKELPTIVYKDGVITGTAHKGGGGLDDKASQAARQFHDAITAGTDMIGLNLTILGDPYYMGDSGWGNYSAAKTDNPFVNADSKLDWQRGEVYIKVMFKSPVDINQKTGMYDLQTTIPLSLFSGLYKVREVTSSFSRGKFVQQLQLYRMVNQNNPAPNKPIIATGSSFSIPGVQVFDDGSTLQTFDDGSTLAVGTDGSVTSTPASG